MSAASKTPGARRSRGQEAELWRRVKRVVTSPGARIVFVAVIVVALLIIVYNGTDLIHEGWQHLRRADKRYIAAAVLVLAVGMAAQAEMMVVLLRAAGVRAGRFQANVLGLIANAWSSTLPGGPAISAATIFRRQLTWGATTVIASWYLVISGVLASAAMAILGLAAVIFLDAQISWWTILASLVTLALVIAAFRWVGRHPTSIYRAVRTVVAWFNRLTRAPEHRWQDALDRLPQQLTAVNVPSSALAWALVWASANWLFEIASLYICLIAVGVHPTASGTALAFLLAKLVGQAQLTPGGVGPVDVALFSLLVPLAQIPSAGAIAGVFVYRALSFVGLAAVGWVVFLIDAAVQRR